MKTTAMRRKKNFRIVKNCHILAAEGLCKPWIQVGTENMNSKGLCFFPNLLENHAQIETYSVFNHLSWPEPGKSQIAKDSTAKSQECGTFSKHHWREMCFAGFAINLPVLFCFEDSSYNKSKAKWRKSFRAEHFYYRTYQLLGLHTSYCM